VVASLLAAVLVAAGGAVAATTFISQHGATPIPSTRQAQPSPTQTLPTPLWQIVPAPAAAELSPLAALPSQAPRLNTAAVTRQLAASLADAALAGASTSVVVTDPLTRSVVLDQHGSDAVMPASTAKLAVAVAALEVLGPQHRFSTRVLLVSGSGPGGGTPGVVLVGGGDPTLAGPNAVGHADPGYPRPARLADLATATASALKNRGLGEVGVGYDDSLFAGPRTAPGWKTLYINEGDVAPVSALEVDEGRPDPAKPPRADDPAAVAAREFAALLTAHGIHVAGSPRPQSAHPAGEQLASVSSPPLAAQVQRMLGRSDNDLAEALGRHVAIATGHPATFAGAAAAIEATLGRLGVSTTGMAMVDASGLSRQDRLQPRTLTGLVDLVLRGDHPDLASILPALPVAGFSGTLATRYTAPPAAAAAGLVRAKTGTLNGVVTLAGYLRDASGRVLSFAVVVNGLPANATLRAESAVDKVVAALAGCGCS
jgi:D-alanyl-D-alanine carboxypeptidase/D-alanyl-D-alanine-endopeptidase (penicillin-binding protein 4)